MVDACRVKARMGDRSIQVVEDVTLFVEVRERTDDSQHADVFGSRTLEQHRHAPLFEVGDDLAEGLGAGRVQHLQVG